MNFISRCVLPAALALLLLSGSATSAWASVTTRNSPAAPDTSNTLYQVRDGDAAYVAPTNGYDDGGVTAYCLLTQDASKAGLTSVTAPDGTSHALASVYVGTALSAAAGAGGCIAADKTLFVDPGTYNSDLEYVGLDFRNFSLVGLGGGGSPAVTLVRTFSSSSPADGTVDRYQFSNATDIYLGNVILDGAGRNLRNSSGFGYYALNVGIGTDGFVMRNVIIQKVGASNIGTQRNSALNIVYANTGTHHFVNLTVRDIKTTASAGVVFTNQSKGVYFSDLTVDASQANAASNGVRIENASTAQLPLVDNMAVFAGNTLVSTGFIQVQDYRYDKIGVPSDYRYVEYTTSNANGSTGAYRVHKTLPAAAANKAILDRTDGYWVVRHGQANRTVTQQLSDIAAVRNVVASALSAIPARIPAANIKLAVATPAEIATFTVANFGAGVPVSLVAVPAVSAPATSTVPVPVAAGFTASFGTTANSANIALYNFDFATVARYTLAETVSGISPAVLTASDPRDGSYPAGLNVADYRPAGTVAARLAAASPVTAGQLRNATFVALASGAAGSPTALNLIVGDSSLGLDTTTTAVAAAPAWYTAATAPTTAGTAGADDPSVAYFSSDPTVATVDSATGRITAVGVGTATVYAKAKDSLNNGELEKPYASTTVRVSSEPALALAKSAEALTDDVAGTDVQYHFRVTNTGNVRLTGVTLFDPEVSGLSCPATTLEPAESMRCAASHTLTQADVDTGLLHNAATVTGNPRIGDPVTATDSVDVTIPARAAIEMPAGTATFPSASPGTLEYRFSVANSGNVTLTDVTFTDPLLPSVSCPTAILAPGQTMSCLATYALPQAVIDTGHVDLALDATGTAPDGDPVIGGIRETLTIPATAAIRIVGTASDPSTTIAGAVVSYQFVVTNTGSLTLTGVAVSDTGLDAVTCPADVLAPGASMVCTATRVVAQADLDAGQLPNTAISTGTTAVAGAVSDSAVVDSALLQVPRLEFEKTVATSAVEVSVGTPLTYSFRVTNSGNLTLSDVQIDDPLLAGVTCPALVLKPEEQMTCTGAPYLVTATDQTAGKVVNTAWVTSLAGCESCGTQHSTWLAATSTAEIRTTVVEAESDTDGDGDGHGSGLANTGADVGFWLQLALGLALVGTVLRLGAGRSA